MTDERLTEIQQRTAAICAAEDENRQNVGHKRLETGPVQVEGDWPGLFIRGDNAAGPWIKIEPGFEMPKAGVPLVFIDDEEKIEFGSYDGAQWFITNDGGGTIRDCVTHYAIINPPDDVNIGEVRSFQDAVLGADVRRLVLAMDDKTNG